MKIFSIFIFRKIVKNGENVVIKLAEEFQINNFSFFQRSSVKEIMTFLSRCLVQQRESYETISIINENNKDYVCHMKNFRDGLVYVVITDCEYPSRVVNNLITEVNRQFKETFPHTWENLDKLVKIEQLGKIILDYQQPDKIDKITKIKIDVAETKQILIKSIDDLLLNNEDLEDLITKSSDLSLQSKVFLKKSETMNKCCVLL